MTDLVPAFSGEVMLASWKETHTGGAVVSFFLPNPADLDVFRGMTVRKGGTAGQRLACVLVEIGEDETPKSPIFVPHAGSSPTPENKPFGKQASELYRTGFFYAPAVLEAIGTDAEFLLWIKSQPCAAEHLGDCNGDVVAAHVRRIANGAGTGIKPNNYSAIPLCHKHHALQHQNGESALVPKDHAKD